MVTIKDTDTLSAYAEAIIDKLYDVALCDTRIMVCNWLAYAVLAAYRMANDITGEGYTPLLEDCFNGTAVPPELSNNPKWDILSYWHNYHWERATSDEGEAEYEAFFNVVAIDLGDVMLTQ